MIELITPLILLPMGTPESVYNQRRDAFAAEERRLAGISFRFSLFRGALFLAFVICLGVILARGGRPGWEWWAGAGFWLAAFVGVLPWHDRIIQRQRRNGELRRVNEEGLLRRARDWERLPRSRRFPSPRRESAPMARDLNLFGRASLAQLLGTVHSPPGKSALSRWLLHPAPPPEIAERQAAVAELAPEIDLRQQLEVGVRPMETSPPDLEPLLRWAEGGPWLLDRPGLIWLARLLAVATPAALLLWVATTFPLRVFLLLAMVNIVLGYLYRGRTHATFDKVESREGDFQRYAEALQRIAAASYTAAELRRIAGELGLEGQAGPPLDAAPAPPGRALARPPLVLPLHDPPVAPLLGLPRAGPAGDVAAARPGPGSAGGSRRSAASRRSPRSQPCASTSPSWSFPDRGPSGDRLRGAEALGHPLIADGQRVANDVEVGPGGHASCW